MKELNYAAIMLVFTSVFFLSACSGEVGAQSCSGDHDCLEGYYCAVSGGVFFSSDVCSPKMGTVDGDTYVVSDVQADGSPPKDSENNPSDVLALADSDVNEDEESDIGDQGDGDAKISDPLVLKFHRTPDADSMETEVRFKFGCEEDAIKECSYLCRVENSHHSGEMVACESELVLDVSGSPFGKHTLYVTATDNDQRQAKISYSWNFNFGWKHVSAGAGYTCGVVSNGALYCWGVEKEGRLGLDLNGEVGVNAPERVGNANDWAVVDASHNHTCGLRTDGSLWCWGSNHDHQLGIDPEIVLSRVPVRVDVSADSVWKSIAIGERHSCAIREDDSLWCWGGNDFSQLGFQGSIRFHIPQRVGFENDWMGVFSAGNYTCAMKADETVQCWGDNDYRQLGLGDSAQHPTRKPTSLPDQARWASFSAGQWHSCGVKTDGTLWCWGETRRGKLGLGSGATNARYSTPMQVGLSSDWSTVSVKKYHSCAITGAGALWCWGNAYEGQLGLGNRTNDRTEPEKVSSGPSEWDIVSTGQLHTCGISSAGRLFCWGEGLQGELGHGDSSQYRRPVEVDWRP